MKTAFALVAFSTVLASAALAQDAVSAKGIYRDPAATSTKNGLAYRIMLIRSDARHEVPVSFPFRSGDRFKLQLNLKDAAFVYVLNRTFNGDPKEMGEKGIERVRDEDRDRKERGQGTYTLLFPAPGERAEKIPAGHYRDIPGDVSLRMDKNPGVEKLYVIVSDTELDIPKMFPGGQLRASGKKERHSDSSGDVLDRLNKDLTEWAKDSQTESAPAPSGDDAENASSKGIERDTYTVGSRNKPILAEITLRHFAE